MKGIIKFFIQYPTLVNLFLFLLVGLGVLQLSRTRSTNFPTQKVRYIDITMAFPGASPSEVEEGITIKVEDNLEGIPGIDRVTSSSKENLAIIHVELEEYSDPNKLLVEVKNAVDKINDFPRGAEPASVEKREPQDITLSIGLVGDLPLQVMKDYADEIRNDLMSMPGISRVYVQGVPDQEIEISVRENDLRAYHLSIQHVMMAVRNANLETFGGNIETEKENISIKANSKGYYAKDLQNIVVRADPNGNTIYLKDVAEIKDQFKDNAAARYLENEQIVVVNVYTLSNEDIIQNAEQANEYLTEFNETHQGIQLKVLEDGTVNLRNRLKTMVDNGVVGIILVLVVLSLFLDRYLASLVAMKIPVAIIGMFIVAEYGGITLNVVSLFGFILVLGILVDDGVVIAENIYRHAKELGKKPLQAALDGTVEVVTPVIISLTTTAVAFSMFLFLPTKAGDFFSQMAFVVISVLIVALLESFFVLPAHMAHSKGLKDNVKLTKIEKWFGQMIDFLRNSIFLPAFKVFVIGRIGFKWLAIFFFIFVLVGSVALIPSGVVNFTFFPTLDDDAAFMELDLPPGTPVEVTRARLAEIEAAAWKVNEHYNKQRKDGKEVIRFVEQITGPLDNQGKVKVTFLGGEDRGVSSFELSNAIRDFGKPIPEATRLIYGIGATSAVFGMPISVALIGEDAEQLRMATDDLKAGMNLRTDIKDVSDTDMSGSAEVNVTLKPKAELLGLSLSSVMNQIRAGFFGAEAQSLQRGENEVEIWVRYPEKERNSIASLLDMKIQAPGGLSYFLRDVANVEKSKGTLTINHIDGRREIRVEANVADVTVSAPRAIASIESDILKDLVQKYPSVSYSIEGQNRMSFKILGAIKTVGPIIMVFIFALIVINCNSFSQAATVFSMFPFMLPGVIFGHWIHGTALSIFSLIGTIALIGVFVNDSLVFTSAMNDLLREGRSFKDSLLETARSRFRPILLTTVTTVAGLGPLIASSSLGAQFLKGPAIAIAYGLAYGLLNVLILFPLALFVVNRIRVFWYNLWHKDKTTPEQVEPAVRKMKFLITD